MRHAAQMPREWLTVLRDTCSLFQNVTLQIRITVQSNALGCRHVVFIPPIRLSQQAKRSPPSVF